MQPLAGLLVLDFTTLLPGPLASLMLAEAGAEVIKIERPGGEDMRRFPPFKDGASAVFAMLNRGKQGLTLDLRNEADRAQLAPLIARADIVLEQFRPGVMTRLGLGYDDLRKINPRLIYCSISGYGQDGPRAQEAGHDINYIGATGVLDLQPGPIERPVVPPMLVADIAGGSFPAMINILLALRARDVSGEGCHLDIAMTDAMFTFAWYALAFGAAIGRFPQPGELPVAGASPRYQLYRTRDGRLVALRRAGAEVLAGVHAGDRARAGVRRRRARSERDARGGRCVDRRAHGGGVAAGARRGRLLRDGRCAVGRGDARPAFRRASAFLAHGRSR